jgi:hypothetical protein
MRKNMPLECRTFEDNIYYRTLVHHRSFYLILFRLFMHTFGTISISALISKDQLLKVYDLTKYVRSLFTEPKCR